MVFSSNKAIGEESTPAQISLLSRGRVFSCRHCSRQFSTLQALGGHQNAHINKKQPMPTPSDITIFSSIFAHHQKKKWRRSAPRAQNSLFSMHGLSTTADLNHSSLSPSLNTTPPHSSAQLGFLQNPVSTTLFGGLQSCGSKIELKETVLQPIAHNGGGNKAEIKEAVSQHIAHNCGGRQTDLKEAVFQPIAHNGPVTVTVFGGGDPCSLESAGQKEGSYYSFQSVGQKEVGGLEGGCYSFEPPCKKDGEMSFQDGEMSFQSSCLTTVMIEDDEELDLSLHL